MAEEETPPENPFDTNGGHDDNGAPVIDAEESLPQGAPNVAARAGKTFVVLGIVGAVVLFLLYSILSGGKEEKKAATPDKVAVSKNDLPPPPPPVEPPQTITPPPQIDIPLIPPPTQVPDSLSTISPLAPKEDAAAKAQQQARLRSGIMVRDGGGVGAGLLGGGDDRTATPTDPNSAFAAMLGNSRAERVEATRLTDLRRTIAQGRIIQATMESALNTDLPAPIRAIVSLDVYGEAGTVPLIPKGSRLIGQYNTTLTSGQTRVFVVWTRVIRPDGVDVALGSPLVDAIGQAGVSGQLDTKFQEIFARSLMSSAMNIAMAIGSDEITGGGSTTTTTSTTGTQTSGDAATTATTNALNRLGSTTDGFLQRFLNVPPTILVDQGTKVNVFVNKDILFPADAAGLQVIQ